ncbi:MAG: glycerol-3-phosphate dehydrogenase [Myxococcota bacterium]
MSGAAPAVGVIGGGPWGLALARATRRAKRAEVVLYTRRHDEAAHPGIRIVRTLAPLAETPLIIMAVPSPVVRLVARDLGDHVSGRHMVVHGIRGLSDDDLLTVSQILRDETPVRRLGALGGPVQAPELHSGRASAMIVGSAFPDVTATVAATLDGPWLQVKTTRDLLGLEWAAALMGCLSVGLGYAQVREDVSPGLLAALLSGAVDEAVGIARVAGADASTLYGLGGYGDLLASMALPGRPEVVVGRALARGATPAEAQREAELRVEAVDLVPRVARFAQRHGVAHGFFAALAEILSGAASPEAAVAKLFRVARPD